MRKLYCTLTALALLLVAPTALAATITVNSTDDEVNADGDCSLREAVMAANTDTAVDGCTAGTLGPDTIEFADGVDDETFTVGETLMVSDSLTVDGGDGDDVTISGGDARRVILVRSGMLTLRNLTITGGNAVRGSGVFIPAGGDLTAENVTFTDNEATGSNANDGGAAVYVNGGATATFTDCSFTDNTASGTSGSGGAILSNGGTIADSSSTYSGNTANRAGGAIEANGASSTTLVDVDFDGNEAGDAPGNGGAFHISGSGSASITRGTVSNNVAAREGGGFWNGSGEMTILRTTFTGNEAEGDSTSTGTPVGGGAIFNNGGTLVADTLTVTGNSATGFLGSGGGFFSTGGAMTINGGTISGNAANRAGAGVETAGGNTTLNEVMVMNNDIATANPGNGGGVHAAGDSLFVNGGTFSDNDATEGGAIWANSVLIVDGATISDNTGDGDDATNGGGGIYVEDGGEATISGTTIDGNDATGTSGSGGGLFVADGATADVSGGTISNNTANRAGAGIEVAGGDLTLTDVEVSTNIIPALSAAPGNGGGLHSGGGSVTVNGGVFDQNQATEGGGLWTSGSLTVQRSDADSTVISGNIGRGNDAANGGGGVYAESGASVELLDALITGNAATGTSGSGGGLFVADSSEVRVSRGSIVSNQANRAGAGIEVADNPATRGSGDTDGDGDTDDDDDADGLDDTILEVIQVMVADNSIAVPAPGNGGGLHIGGAAGVTVRRSTFSGNTAAEGAGLWASGASSLMVDVSTVTGNTATGEGGGIYDDGGATIAVRSSTVALNEATEGGGLLSQTTDGRFSLSNTALAYNVAATGADCSGSFASGDYNFIQTTAGCTFTGDTGNNVTGSDPLLGPLADNGGETMTHLPQTGSPLIDAGQSEYAADQRGLARSGAADIGSVEFDAGDAVDGENGPDGEAFALLPARPNPMRGRATLAYTVAESGDVRIELYNVLGQRVQTLYDGPAVAGSEQTVALDASQLAAGVYIVRLESQGQQATQRVTVVR